MKYNICAIITVYYPDDSILINIARLEKQVSLVIITDNTPENNNSGLFSHCTNVIYQNNKTNLGLSKAFNRCLKIDAVKKSDFIIFLDQDSVVPENLIHVLINDYNMSLQKGNNVGCIGPIYYESNSMKLMVPRQKNELGNNIYSVKSIMTSAMLTTYANLRSIGFWNEKIFLDLADWDLCWRFIKAKFLCCITRNVILEHSLGKSVKRFGRFIFKEGTPIREYYQTRDCLKLLIQSYTPVKFKIRFLIMVFFRPLVHIIFLSQKTMRLKYILIGIFDGIRGKSGEYKE